MKLESTICIHEDVKKEIKSLANRSGVSCCKIINKLIQKAICIDNSYIVENQLVEYQKRNMDSCMNIFHYRITSIDHKLYNSVRCRLEISISKLLLVGFLLFFTDVVNELLGSKNEICLNNYTAIFILLYPTITKFLKSIEYQIKKE